MRVSELKPGMKGEARTVLQGVDIVSIPVEILEVVPKQGSPKNLILIKVDGKAAEKTGGIAAGMSGSPVYVKGKLIGAIGYGWDFSTHRMGLVTSIEDMLKIWDNPERIPSFEPAPIIPEKPPTPASGDQAAEKDAATGGQAPEEGSPDLPGASQDHSLPSSNDIRSDDIGTDESSEDLEPISPDPGKREGCLFVGGLSARMSEKIGEILGKKIIPFGGTSGTGAKKVQYGAVVKPGAAIGASLAWGDVEIGAIGTLSAVASDGRFIAFAHPFILSGTSSAALTTARIARVIPGLSSPFKLGYTGDIIGTITQDRPQGIGGRTGLFAPAASCRIDFRDVDAGRSDRKAFQMVQDPYLISNLSSVAITGCIEEMWGRKGAGSAKITTTYSGSTIPNGWTRTNVFVSEKDVASEMLKEFGLLTQLFAVNQFQELRPFGIDVSVEMTREPRVLYIEDVKVPDGPFSPGDRISFDITLRPWRKAPFVRTYSLVLPPKVSGICELLVRGGGIGEETAEYMEAGWRSISSLPVLLKELDAKETNNQIVLELRGQEALTEQIKKAKNADPQDLMNDKLKSEIRAEKMKEGSMRIIRTNYYVDGLINKLVKIVDGPQKETATPEEEPGEKGPE